MGIAIDAQQRERERSGQVIYDPTTNQFMRYEPPPSTFIGSINSNRQGRYVPINAPGFGQTTYTPPTVDFNNLPKHANSQSGVPVQPYVRPNAPRQNIGSGYRPQFDPSFIQQMLGCLCLVRNHLKHHSVKVNNLGDSSWQQPKAHTGYVQ